MNFENKTTKKHGILYSRIIASWENVTGIPVSQDWRRFCDWAGIFLGLDEEEIRDIRILAENGKLELEDSVRKYISDK